MGGSNCYLLVIIYSQQLRKADIRSFHTQRLESAVALHSQHLSSMGRDDVR